MSANSNQDSNKNKDKGCCYWLCKCFFSDDEDNNNKKNNQIKIISDQNKENNKEKERVDLGCIKDNNNSYNQVEFNENDKDKFTNNQINIPIIQTKTITLTLNEGLNITHNEVENNEGLCLIDVADLNKINIKFQIITIVNPSKIIYKSDYHQDLKNKYNCPICLNYLNYILKLSCCKNYICLLCADDYLLTCVKYDYPTHCPFCATSDHNIILTDVVVGDPIKIYSDSPLNTFKKTLSNRFSRIIFLQDKSDNLNQDINFDVHVVEDLSDKIVIIDEFPFDKEEKKKDNFNQVIKIEDINFDVHVVEDLSDKIVIIDEFQFDIEENMDNRVSGNKESYIETD